MNYWTKRAANWVSLTVLAGGMLSAAILFFLAKVEADIKENSDLSIEEFLNK